MSRGSCLPGSVVGGVEVDGSGGLVLCVGLPVARAVTDDGEIDLGRVVDAVAAFEELELHPQAAIATTQTSVDVARIYGRR